MKQTLYATGLQTANPVTHDQAGMEKMGGVAQPREPQMRHGKKLKTPPEENKPLLVEENQQNGILIRLSLPEVMEVANVLKKDFSEIRKIVISFTDALIRIKMVNL